MVTITQAAKGGVLQPALKTTMISEGDLWCTLRMVVLAASGKGKTHMLATASRHYAEPWPTTLTVLDDIYIVSADLGGMLGLREKHFDAPILDISEWSDDEVFSRLADIPRHVAAEVEARKTRLVGIDTIDSLLAAVLNVLSRSYDGAGLYNGFAAHANTFLRGMARVRCPVVYTCHVGAPKVVLRGVKADNSEYMEQAEVAAGTTGKLCMDLGGRKAASVLRNAATLTGHLKVLSLPGDKTERILDFEDEVVESKRRLVECVGKRGPANLAEIFTRIAAGMNVAGL